MEPVNPGPVSRHSGEGRRRGAAAKKHGAAGVPGLNYFFMNKFYGAHIHSAGGLGGYK